MSDVKKVFISGTKLDLESHHQAAIDVCNSLGFLPIDMSFFGAMDENAVEGSKKQLEDCDLYVGIIGFRYGYIAEDHDKSVTEIEFDYARECGIERLCFLAHESHRFSQKVLDPENAERIRQLREKVSTAHIVEFFRNSADFRQKLTETLAKWGSSTRVTDVVASEKASLDSSGEARTRIQENEKILSVLPVSKQLFGRAILIDQIEAALAKNDRVLLHGYAGSGKTAVAAEIVKRHIHEGKGRAIWLEAGPKDTQLLFESLATHFGKEKLKSLVALDDIERISTMRHILKDSDVTLLAIDNAWKWEALDALITATPESIPFLATSRSRYPVNTLIEITDLDPSDAIVLLGDQAGSDYSGDTSAETLCRTLGYHAFSLELIGRTLRVDNLTPTEMIARLESLDYKIREPVPETTRDTDTLLKASLDSLNESELKTFFSFGALYRPTATAELLAFYLGQRTSLITEQLLSLQRRNLVRRFTHPRAPEVVYYRVHDISYRYISKNESVDRAAVGEACRKYINSHQRKTEWLDIELNNILGAASDAQAQGNYELFIDLLYMLAEDGKNTAYFDRRAPTPLAITLFTAAAEAARVIAPRKAYFLLAKLAYMREQYTHELDQSTVEYELSLGLAKQLHEPLLEAKTLSRLAVIYFRKHDPRADEFFKLAEQLAEEHDDKRTLSLVLQNRAFRAASAAEYELGSRTAERAASLSKEMDSYEEVYFWSLHTWGDCELNLGNLDRAQQILEQARTVAQREEMSRWLAYVYESLGDIQCKRGNIQASKQMLEQALSEWNHVGSKDDIEYIRSKIDELPNNCPAS